jgi:hypothetical protein
MSLAIVRDGATASEGSGRALLSGRPVLFLPLLMVNTAAVWGQSGWFHSHVSPHVWTLAIALAVAVESIGIYLSQEAHDARMNDQAAATLQFAAYAVGFVAAGLNYSHFIGQGVATAVTFALMSAISPWLWSVRSRSMNRKRLTELGQSDKRGVKLSTSRKIWHPWMSLQVIRWAAWAGVTNPDDAVRGWELMSGDDDPVPVSGGPGRSSRTPAEWVAAADAIEAERPDLTQKQVAQQLGVSDTYLRRCRRATRKEGNQ